MRLSRQTLLTTPTTLTQSSSSGLSSIDSRFPDGILPGPGPPRYGVTDDDDTRVSESVVFGKLAACEQAHSHGAKISRTHAQLVHKIILGEPPIAFQMEIPHHQLPTEWLPVHRTRRKRSWQAREFRQSAIVKSFI
jgi:hypothetical protein